MNQYKISLSFPDLSEKVPALIEANSLEEAIERVRIGNGVNVLIEEGDPDAIFPNPVSVVYIESRHLTTEEITCIYKHMLSKSSDDGNITETVSFPNGMQMDIKAVSEKDESGWTEAVLFNKSGGECGYTEVEEKYDMVWDLCDNGIMYIAAIVPESSPWLDSNIIALPGSCLDTTAKVIAHQTNCQGIMGAGVAKAIREKYPEIMQEYQDACHSRHMLGKCQLVETEEETIIANLFGQDGFGAGRQTDYDALQSALDSLVDQMYELGLTSVAMPYYIGCGLAGGDWDVVLEMLKKTFSNTSLRLELWKLD